MAMLMSTRDRARITKIAYWRDDDSAFSGHRNHANPSVHRERRRTKRAERRQVRQEIALQLDELDTDPDWHSIPDCGE